MIMIDILWLVIFISISFVIFIFSVPLLKFFYPLKFLVRQNSCRIISYAPDEQLLMESQLHIYIYIYVSAHCCYLKYVKTVVGWSSNGSSRNQRCTCESI